MSDLMTISDRTFKNTVLRSPLPVMVEFWAEWCEPCQMLAPVLDRIAARYGGRVLVARVNVDENMKWARRLGVRSIPSILFFSDGQLVSELIGPLGYSGLTEIVNQLLESNDRADAGSPGWLKLGMNIPGSSRYSCLKSRQLFSFHTRLAGLFF